MSTIFELSDRIREIAYDIHTYHKNGYTEKPYVNALAHRLTKAGLAVQEQCPISIRDEDGTPIGDYYADLLIDERLIIEVKAVKTLTEEHEAQILAYLKASRIEHGLLINFGSYRFQIRKYAWSAKVQHVLTEKRKSEGDAHSNEFESE
jgi:GxxExxY protein